MRRFSNNFNTLLLDRMDKRELPAMQVNATIFIGVLETIFDIAPDGPSHFGQLNSDLVRTASKWADL